MTPPTGRWGIAAELRPLAGGHRNRAFRTIGLPQDLVFKSTRRPAAAVEWLLPVQALARACGLAVPHLRPSLAGNLVEQGWTCEDFLAGNPFSGKEMPAILPMIRQFHAAASDLPQRPGFLSSQDLIHQTCGGDVDLAFMPARLVQACRAAWSALPAGPQTVIHGDLNPSNLLHCPDGGIALLDWDECRRDLAQFDLGQLAPPSAVEHRALLAWEVACSWAVEPAHARALARRLAPAQPPARIR
ncbi:MAG: phosphotransferase [Paracoccaceae bacterium]